MSVCSWILIFSLTIACVVGSFTHWIIGVIVFFMIAGKALIYGLVMDTISDSLKYHHDRQDSRAKKTMESIRFLTTKNTDVVMRKGLKKINL